MKTRENKASRTVSLEFERGYFVTLVIKGPSSGIVDRLANQLHKAVGELEADTNALTLALHGVDGSP